MGEANGCPSAPQARRRRVAETHSPPQVVQRRISPYFRQINDPDRAPCGRGIFFGCMLEVDKLKVHKVFMEALMSHTPLLAGKWPMEELSPQANAERIRKYPQTRQDSNGIAHRATETMIGSGFDFFLSLCGIPPMPAKGTSKE